MAGSLAVRCGARFTCHETDVSPSNLTSQSASERAIAARRSEDWPCLLALASGQSPSVIYSRIRLEELEAIKARVREMEEEAEKLKELQNEVEKQMNMSPPPGNAGPVIMSIEEKMEADARSIYVGNVDYGATAEELEAHFHGCGSVNRVTILCDKFSGHPKGFAYIEFSDKESVRTSLALDESLFRGRQIKVIPKRTNRPGISTTDRGFPRARYRARTTNYNSSRSRFYSGFNSRPRGRVYRGRARATSWYSPY
ncbi:polyadenylate-binding protein 2 isoform X2 [Canis lupus baileyi]|uniref:polyadenylate-binding protein 2 isoform X2 n=1 Tax=Canis lupus dingo TaxID=286419 RepID=UPI0003AE4F79|nr:polyadenylate-binding protein 2 isoform X2 [Canis lupus dingo]XP_038528756.1 polyadenylate-binding protein 2 isoform X1 [Canis lupus familiaris]|eukprot:XP_005623225.1 polyadenylate-binding protein 2 isoform X1 [Canis lupus familiaris]